MINCAKECLMIFFMLLLFCLGSLIVMPIAILGILYFIILAIIKLDIKYIDEEL